MQLHPLTALSPVDGRYFGITQPLASYFSEYGLMRYRIRVEVEYFIALTRTLPELAGFPQAREEKLRSLYLNFNEQEAQSVKEIEKTTNHDVKAVEYYLKRKFDDYGWEKHKEFIHFGLTSQDINNTAIPLSLKEFLTDWYLPGLEKIISRLTEMAIQWKDVPMLARTHGQPASPTRVGKEIDVFVERLKRQKDLFITIPHAAKFGGATGNFNAHHVAYPDVNWKQFADAFVQQLGLIRSEPTTQIEHYDNLAAQCDALKRINTILLDLCRDMWHYISLDYFVQQVNPNEVGSSAMPHKVNPIDFENAEGNLGLANSIFEHLSVKLPVSRLQRDLTDSTVLRNLGVPLAHTWIAFNSILRGLNKIILNDKRLREDLENNWVVIAEAIQTILRKEGYPNPYEALKELTRKNEKIGKDEFDAFINGLAIPESLKEKLKAITPFNYTGI
ncbi:MAG: adenylosuccinate lyase [Cyclobacteriaceae bacterium]|nr:adenylosuccinate lyase [Cyclobacteriaceae bacterium]